MKLLSFIIIFLFSSIWLQADDIVSSSLSDIIAIPKKLDPIYHEYFDRASLITSSQGDIMIIAQNQVTSAQILRVRNILLHFLNPYKGSVFGGNKTAIMHKMAQNNAMIALLNGRDDGSNPVAEYINAQPLYAEEMQVEGSSWYINQNYEYRDASFEEILHLIHDTGIGVDGDHQFQGAQPLYQKAIRLATNHALRHSLWGRGGRDTQEWLDELAQENSLTQEYLASLIDSYYGLWGAWHEDKGGMWGIYVAKTRSEMEQLDPVGYKLIENKFFHPYLTYNALIDKSFKGDFWLDFNPLYPYSHHSQYLKAVTLQGQNHSNVVANRFDNDITGNEGVNKVIFQGKKKSYIIEKQSDSTIIVKDTRKGYYGTNILRNIEFIQFDDMIIDISKVING